MDSISKMPCQNKLTANVTIYNKNASNRHRKRVFKKVSNFIKTRGYPYILGYEMEVASPFNKWLISYCEQKTAFKLNQRKAVRDAKSAVASILLLKKNIPKVVFMFPLNMLFSGTYLSVLLFVNLNGNCMYWLYSGMVGLTRSSRVYLVVPQKDVG